MTERLYYRDATWLEFDAHVIEHVGDARHVVLDRTAFYPTSGGQPHDTGSLGAARVIDVIDEAERVVHVTDAPVPLGPIGGAVDSLRRHDHMQQHSAQHLLSALAADRLHWDTTSVHFGAEYSTIEFESAAISETQLAELEGWANQAVADARPVTVSLEDAASAHQTGLRKASLRSGEIRIVTIDGIDRSACGGTHVSRTSEIGSILLLGVEKIRGHVRVAFVAGTRVLRHAHARDRILLAIAQQLGCGVDAIEPLFSARLQEAKALRDLMARLEQEVAVSRLRTALAETIADADGNRRVLHRAVEEPASMLRAMAQAAGSMERIIFVALASSPSTIYFATSADTGIDAGSILKAALAATGGRGGGSPRLAQGTGPSDAALLDVADTIWNSLSNSMPRT